MVNFSLFHARFFDFAVIYTDEQIINCEDENEKSYI